jgi:hypothetical protein
MYSPRDFLIDTQGYIRYDHIGEGDYNTTEGEIQSLLAEDAALNGMKEISFNIAKSTTINPASLSYIDLTKQTTPEIYLVLLCKSTSWQSPKLSSRSDNTLFNSAKYTFQS